MKGIIVNKKSIFKVLISVFAAGVLIAAFAVCSLAVPAEPGSGHTGADAACRSHYGKIVTLDNIPTRTGAKRAPSIAPVDKNIPLLTIVVGFLNMPYQDDWDWADEMFVGEKSLSAYYSDMSFGHFTFTPAAESSAFGVGGNTNDKDKKNDGVVHVNISSEHRDWANEDEYPALAQALIEAIYAADVYVDFASFDSDGNGRITENELAVGFVIAGYEASTVFTYPQGIEKYLWAHAWSISGIFNDYNVDLALPSPDGTKVDSYIAIAEQVQSNKQEPISVLAHELGHYLGLPDLYDTSYINNSVWSKYAVGNLSVMADGCWGTDPDGGYIPYSMDVWSRYALGWCEPVTAKNAGDYSVIAQSYNGNDAYTALYIPTQRDGEYYLAENRQFVKWDAGLAGGNANAGVILWHIDDAVFEQYNADNRVNDTFHRPAVMPLYPEKLNGTYTYLGNTASVLKTKGFYSASAWAELFSAETLLDLPLYGEGEDADSRNARTLSGIKIGFPDDSDADMTVRLYTADHLHFLKEIEYSAPTCENKGINAHFACTYCGAAFADAEGQSPLAASDVEIPASGHSFINYTYNNDATCTSDGTETAYCEHGCGKTDERTAEGTKLPHAYGDPVWTWADGFSKATATFTCSCGEKKTVEDTSPVKTVVSDATATEDQIIKYVATVTFEGREYTDRTGNINVPGTATGVPTQSDTQPGDLCPLDGVDHGNSFFGKIIRFIHGILYFISHLFG